MPACFVAVAWQPFHQRFIFRRRISSMTSSTPTSAGLRPAYQSVASLVQVLPASPPLFRSSFHVMCLEGFEPPCNKPNLPRLFNCSRRSACVYQFRHGHKKTADECYGHSATVKSGEPRIL